MISGIKCEDLEKQYFDEIDESSSFIRKEECKHYEISMKRISPDFKFEKFIIKLICKNCNNEQKQSLTKNRGEINYQCLVCNYCQITFNYENTLGTNDESNKNNEKEIINIINKGENKKKKEVLVNEDLKLSLIENKLKAGEEKDKKASPKIYDTPNNSNNSNNTNEEEKKNQKKIYFTPPPPPPAYKPIKINFKYNDSKEKIELNLYDTLANQTQIIQDKFNIKKELYFYNNSELIDEKKTLKELGLCDKFIIEVDTIKYKK